mgnify:CR=1 FL=1
MEELDQLSARFAHRLEGVYDCPDRIVLNAFYPLGYNPGGFREWWRRLHGGDDDLDDAHLMRMAGRFSLMCCSTSRPLPSVRRMSVS